MANELAIGSTAKARTSWYRWIVMLLIFIVYTIAYADRSNLGVALPFIKKEFALQQHRGRRARQPAVFRLCGGADPGRSDLQEIQGQERVPAGDDHDLDLHRPAGPHVIGLHAQALPGRTRPRGGTAADRLPADDQPLVPGRRKKGPPPGSIWRPRSLAR